MIVTLVQQINTFSCLPRVNYCNLKLLRFFSHAADQLLHRRLRMRNPGWMDTFEKLRFKNWSIFFFFVVRPGSDVLPSLSDECSRCQKIPQWTVEFFSKLVGDGQMLSRAAAYIGHVWCPKLQGHSVCPCNCQTFCVGGGSGKHFVLLSLKPGFLMRCHNYVHRLELLAVYVSVLKSIDNAYTSSQEFVRAIWA